MESVTLIPDIIKRIQCLDYKEKLHIFNILKGDSYEYSTNSNGYFFNLSKITPITLEKVTKCLEMIESNRDIIKEMDRRREELIVYYRGIIEDKLQMSLKAKVNDYMTTLKLRNTYYNIHLVCKRKEKIKKRFRTDEDPDVLMKEYARTLCKYDKNSVYFRIVNKLKAMASTKLITYKDEKEFNYIMDENENEYGEIGEAEDLVEELPDIADEELPEIGEDLPEIGEELPDIAPDGLDNDIISYTENEITETETDEQTKEEEENSKKTLLYYKKLLNQQGFSFKETKLSLEYQDYIY